MVRTESSVDSNSDLPPKLRDALSPRNQAGGGEVGAGQK